MAKKDTLRREFTCERCGATILLPPNSQFCPFCGGKVESKLFNSIESMKAESAKLLPVLEKQYKEFSKTYLRFRELQRILRVYASEGIIDKSDVLDFNGEPLPGLTRKKKEG